MEAAEKASWDLANKNRILGLENRRKSKHFINDNFCQHLYFLFILWPSAIDRLVKFLLHFHFLSYHWPMIRSSY